MLEAANRAPRRRKGPRQRAPGPPNFPTAVYEVHRPKPKPAPRSTPKQVHQALEQRKTYQSQAGAVRRAALVQQRVGPGEAVRPAHHGRVLRASDVKRLQRTKSFQARQQAKQHVSQGAAVERVANQRNRAALKKQRPSDIYETDPKKLEAMGFVPAGLADKLASLGPRIAANAPKDAAELAVTTPSSIAKLATTAVMHPHEVAGMLAAPYIEAAKHPAEAISEHPVSTYLMFAPGVKVPLRAAGRVARVAGKQSLVRETATMPGTAFKEHRLNPREVVHGAVERAKRRQTRKTGRGGSEATVRDVQRRVDEHAEQTRQHAHRVEQRAIHEARKATKGQPKADRREAMQAAAEQAREQARLESDAQFAHDFGANRRPQTQASEVKLAEAKRGTAREQHAAATKARKLADKAHEQALTDARIARARQQNSPQLAALKAERQAAYRNLTAQQRAALEAERELARTHAGARVSAAKAKVSTRLLALHAEHRAIARRPAPGEVLTARAAVRSADRQVAQLEREMQRAQETASRLEGVTEGRHAAGRMTGVAGRRAADQAEHIGRLSDALAQARREAGQARGALERAEGSHRATIRDATKKLTKQIQAERKRISGVAPKEHEALLGALERHATAPEHVNAAFERARDVNRRIAAERQRISGVPPAEHDALLRAIHDREHTLEAERAAREHRKLTAAEHKATKRAHREGPLVEPADVGRLFDNIDDAKRVVRKLNEEQHQIPVGGVLPGQLHVREPGAEGPPVTRTPGVGRQPLTFKVHRVGEDQFAVVPKIARQRMYGGGGSQANLSHASVGTGKATGAKVMRASRRQFTQSTLPLSLKWLAGQGVEAAVRAVITGAGAVDYVRFGQVVRRMNRDRPGSGDDFAMRMLGGGLFDPVGAVGEQLGRGGSLAEEFAGTPLRTPAAATTLVGNTMPMRVGRSGWHAVSRGVVGNVNRFIETGARRAMAGHAIKHGPLMERHFLGTFDKAIGEAADGLHATENQVMVGRQLDTMYGRYSKWTPERRSLLMHWTPFLPWYINSARFLLHTLPVEHPVRAALLADVSQAELEWRKHAGISLYGKHLPNFLLGSYPTKKGPLRIAHYTPWGIGSDLAGAASDMVLPQFLGPLKNLGGIDWKWQPLEHADKTPFNQRERMIRAATTAVEGQVPGVSQAGALTGVTPRYVDRRKDVGTLSQRAGKLLPTTPAKRPRDKPKRKSGLSGGFGGGGFSGGGFGGGGLG